MELNKIFAAVLVAGIVASLSGFIAKELVHPKHLHEDAVHVEGVEEAAAGGGVSGPAMPEPILAMIASADVERGAQLSKACTACHNFEKGGPNGTGPNLWGIVGAARAHHADFAYSDAMTAMGGIWTYNELNHFLWKPKAYIPGTKMNYIGLKKPEDRAALVAWLRTLSDNVRPLPDEAEIAAEQAELAPEPAEVPADAAVEGEGEEAPVDAEPAAGAH